MVAYEISFIILVVNISGKYFIGLGCTLEWRLEERREELYSVFMFNMIIICN